MLMIGLARHSKHAAMQQAFAVVLKRPAGGTLSHLVIMLRLLSAPHLCRLDFGDALFEPLRQRVGDCVEVLAGKFLFA